LYIELEDGEQIEQVKNDIIITTIDIDVIHWLYDFWHLTPLKTNLLSIDDWTGMIYSDREFKTISIKFLPYNEYQLIFTF
jgi:hypothetical protein